MWGLFRKDRAASGEDRGEAKATPEVGRQYAVTEPLSEGASAASAAPDLTATHAAHEDAGLGEAASAETTSAEPSPNSDAEQSVDAEHPDAAAPPHGEDRDETPEFLQATASATTSVATLDDTTATSAATADDTAKGEKDAGAWMQDAIDRREARAAAVAARAASEAESTAQPNPPSPADAAGQNSVTGEHDATGDATAVAGDGADTPSRPPLDPAEQLEQWRSELAVVGGAAPLRYFSDESGTFVELTTAHPGGLAELAAGKTTRLSHLIRDRAAFHDARDASDLIAGKGVELLASRGMSTVQLATGIAEWTHDGIHHRAPVLIRPITLRRSGRDYEYTLKGRRHVNPSLVRALAAQFGVRLRPVDVLRLAREDDSFLPQAVFEHVRREGAYIPGFTVTARAVVSSFGDAADSMLSDAHLESLLGESVVARALAGDREAVRELSARDRQLGERPSPDRRDPASEHLLLDADTEQERILDLIAAGDSFVVDALPGTGLTQTVVNALGHLVAENKRVLIVSPRSATLRTIRQRLRSIGLDGLAVTPRTLRRDAVAAISRHERAERPSTVELHDALVRLRRVLVDYRHGLTRPDPVLGVSALDALEELSRLELHEVPPATTVRLDRASIEAVAAHRSKAARLLSRMGTLGQFELGPDDSPWYGVVFPSSDAAHEARELARELADGEVQTLVRAAEKITGRARLRSPETFAEIGVFLRLLADIRDTLDRFKPDIFDRSLTDMIQATGSRREAADLPPARRRQLRQVAREYVRPGVAQPDDLHETLRRIQRQRTLWVRYVEQDAAPSIPTGIDDLRAHYARVAERLQRLETPLVEAGSPTLTDVPLAELYERLDALAAPSAVFDHLEERLELSEKLTQLGLADLVHDLAERHVATAETGHELALCWWQSVIEDRLRDDRTLLGANTRVLARLEHEFRAVDEAHTESAAQGLAWRLAERWRVALVDEVDEVEPLREMLRRPGVSSATLAGRAPRIARVLTSVWLATPYDVPLIANDIDFDVVMIVNAGAVSVAEALGALRRAPQLIALGDEVTEHPSEFSIAVRPVADIVAARERDELAAREQRSLEAAGAKSEPTRDELAPESILTALARIAPRHPLTRSYRAAGLDLAAFINERYYDNRIRTMPWAGSLLGQPSFSFSKVEGGTGMPDPVTGAVESPDAEVTRIVELVVDHAIRRPRESLMVVTPCDRHVQRVTQAVYSVAAQRREVAEYLSEDRAEQFVVVRLEDAGALSRDRVLFSLGFGRTPHGRVLTSFGVLGTTAGERMLAVGMTRARKSLTIVSSVAAADLDPSRMTAGTLALARVLAAAADDEAAPSTTDVAERDASAPDEQHHASPMLLDLAHRLEELGVTTHLAYEQRIPLVASYEHRAIAIDTDGLDAVVAADANPTLREALRLRPALLKRLGWYYIRVHAFELFADPDGVALRIARALEAPAALAASRRRAVAQGSAAGDTREMPAGESSRELTAGESTELGRDG